MQRNKLSKDFFRTACFLQSFFNLQGIAKHPKEESYKFMHNLLIGEDTHISPSIKISINECEEKLNNIISETKKWFESKYLIYNHYQVGDWYIKSLIDNLVSPYEHKEISDTIYKITNIRQDSVIITEKFIDIATALLTAYKVSNARTIWESIDDSLILYPSTHYVRENIFYLDDMEKFTTKDSKIHKYINYLIYAQLFRLLYQRIKELLIHSKEQEFDYQNKIYFNIPDYVITLKNSQYEIYAI